MLALLAGTLLVPTADGATIRVPLDQPTIGDGVGAAADGDTVWIACGTYFERRITVDSGILLRGQSSTPGCVVLDAEGLDFALEISSADPVVIEGITFRRGSASGTTVVGTGGATFRKCAWIDNHGLVGGGIRVARDSEAAVEDCLFAQNKAVQSGGAILDVATVVRCSFLGNSAGGQGGAVSGAERVEECVFRENKATAGGAVATSRNAPRCTILGSTFTGNRSTGIGGAVSLETAVGAIQNCRFIDNQGSRGGAVYLGLREDVSAGHIVSWSSFHRNRAEEGAALYVASWPFEFRTAATIYECEFLRNEADVSGAAITTELSSNSTVQRCTFVANAVGLPGAAIDIGPGYFETRLTLRTSIFAFSPRGASVASQGGRVAIFECVNVFGNADGDYVGILTGREGSDGNISLDPTFCNVAEDVLTLASDSPCLPGNHPDGASCGRIGAFDEGCGPSARPLTLERLSWGRVKARYGSR